MTTPDLPADDTAHLIVDLVSTAHALTRLGVHATGPDASPALWRTLAILGDGHALRLGELARQSRVSQPTMTNLVHQLDASGFVRRVADPRDGRAQLIAITDAGRAARREWQRRLGDTLAPLFTDMGVEDRAVLARAVEIVRARLRPPPADTCSARPQI